MGTNYERVYPIATRTGERDVMEFYTVAHFLRDFANETACLSWLADANELRMGYCPQCGRRSKHHLIVKRHASSCQWCGLQQSSRTGTIYHRSRTPLLVWFFAVYLVVSDHRMTVKEMQSLLGVTYKTAWRMRSLIRRST